MSPAISQTSRVICTWRTLLLRHTMLKRSVWTRSAGTPSRTNAASAASIIGSGPQMKN
jgi:hypothetical protein